MASFYDCVPMDLTVNRIATEAYVSPIRPIKAVTSNAERAEIADRLKEAVRATPAAGTGLLVDLTV
jgi:hypothetical protein